MRGKPTHTKTGRLCGLILALGLLVTALVPARADAVTIWREGENTTVSNVNPHPWWYDKVKKDQLSGGEWLSNFSENKVGTAAYDISAPRSGEFTFWLRANPVKSKLSYRVDGGDWKAVDFTGAVQQKNIAADGRPDLRFIGWVKVAVLSLSEGEHTLRFKMHSDSQNHGAIDAFVLTTEEFTPKGTAKPGETTAAEPAAPQPVLDATNSWPFKPRRERLTEGGLLDLSHLNEKPAGKSGFIRLSEDGRGFVKGDGEPIRFWSAVSGASGMNAEEVEKHCGFLARIGVNMIRIHGNLADRSKGAALTDVSEKAVDGILRAVAAARRHGIYVTISPYWYHHKMPASWDLAGYEAGDMPTGSMFFNEKFENAYKGWVKELYTRPNPYAGGVPLKDEPAVAIIQVKNEDSLLFFTFDRIPPEQKRILGRKYGRWLTEKYGSLSAAHRAWESHTIQKPQNPNMIADDWEKGVVGFVITWQYTQEHSGGMRRRVNDQLQFLSETQRAFYAEIDRYYREELGCKQLTNAMNWKSADKLHTDDAERWTYTACDVLAVNRYAGGVHSGENRGYRIDPGHYLVNESILREPLRLPTNLKQPLGHPFIITESAWVHPNLYQTEGPFLAAAYMGLNGVDSLYWFHLGAPTYRRDLRRKFWHVKPGDTGFAIHKWTGSVPQQAGMFPANALIHRLGYVRRGEPVVHEERSLEEMWRRERPAITETETFDPNRDVQDLRYSERESLNVSRLAFLVGPVETVFEGNPARTRVADLSPYIDGAASTVRSNTGEITLDYGVGLCTLDAPKAQGVSGFLREAGGTFRLSDVTIRSDNHYATIEAVAMDDRPLSRSEKVLVQVGTVARLTGWTVKDDTFEYREGTVRGKRIVYTGKPPWRIKNTSANITVSNPDLTKATLLDEAGHAARELPVERGEDGLTVELPPESMYLILQ